MMSSSATVNLLDPMSGNRSNNINIGNANSSTNNAVVDFSVGSMPANYGYDESFSKEDESSENQFKPRILIMGLRK